MTIYDWADRLTIDDRASKSREDFMAICPCHSDTHASLHVYVGSDTGQVVLKCHVCQATGKAVCEALGIDPKELYCDAISGEKSNVLPINRKAKPKKAEKKERKPCKGLYQVGDVWQDGYRITNIYEYQDREGRVVLRKARRELYDDKGERIKKSFAMQSLDVDGKWYPDAGIYINLLYRLPDVIKAVEAGGLILIVEGEKDVDNLRKLGYTATCGLCGGGTGKLEGKWTEDHTKALKGVGQAIVVPDRDAAGEGLAQWICKRLKGNVGEVKILRIQDHCPSLPEHGDFTDWFGILKAQGVKKSETIPMINTMIDAAAVWTKENVVQYAAEEKKGSGSGGSSGGGDDGDGEERYFGLYNYCIKNGCLARTLKDGAQQLCSFLPIPKATIVYDDGGDIRTEYVIGGKRPDGTPLADAVVNGETELAAMRWPMKYWQHWGNIRPVKNAEKMILDAINCAGQRESRAHMVYGHTGMRKVDGKMCYLHAGGAIGAEDVSVRLAGALAYYDMSDMGCTLEDSIAAELIMIDMLPARIIYPLLAQAYLAPLYSELEEMQEPPSYVVFLIGLSGAGKSSIAGYVQAHFGDFYMRRFPANFADTPNGARDKAFWAKDALYTVDDYVPNREGGRSNSADMVANAVISAVADRAERGSLNADKTIRASRPGRCTCIMTGEELPKLTTSRQLRLYRIDVQPGEIAKDMSELGILRDYARAGFFRQCMRGYIEQLLGRWDGIREELRDRLDAASDEARKRVKRKEGRLIEASMHLMMGVGLMLDYMLESGMIDEAARDARYETACAAIASNIEEQGRGIDAAKPEAVWLSTLASLVNTRSVTFVDRSEPTLGEAYRPGMIGYKDESYYYVIAAAADEAIRERLRKGGVELGASSQAIYRTLVQNQHVCPAKNGDPQRNLKVNKRTMRLLWIHRWVLDGGSPPDLEKQGFVPVKGEQLPIEFTQGNERSNQE